MPCEHATKPRPNASSPRTSSTLEACGSGAQKRRQVSSRTIESRSPQAPDDLVISAPPTDTDAVRRAAERARERGAAWATGSAAERAEALLGAAGSLAAAAEDV